MAAFAGKNSRITFTPAGVPVDLLATRWSLNLKVDEIDVTNFESPTTTFNTRVYSLNQFVMGFFDYEFTAEAFWNNATKLFNTPPDIFPGASPATVTLYIDRSAGNPLAAATIDFTYPFVSFATAQTDVRGAVTYNFSMRNGNNATSTITINALL